eukprot:3147100-Alexandrium_andersonii.AAC.1
MLPRELCEALSVQFVGSCRDTVRGDPSLQVSVARLRAAFQWLVRHNVHWASFGSVSSDGGVIVPPDIEALFALY